MNHYLLQIYNDSGEELNFKTNAPTRLVKEILKELKDEYVYFYDLINKLTEKLENKGYVFDSLLTEYIHLDYLENEE